MKRPKAPTPTRSTLAGPWLVLSRGWGRYLLEEARDEFAIGKLGLVEVFASLMWLGRVWARHAPCLQPPTSSRHSDQPIKSQAVRCPSSCAIVHLCRLA